MNIVRCSRMICKSISSGAAGPAIEGHVDHFVAWSRYPLDLGHNFVLAHDSCNAAKADHIAACEHAWVERNVRYASDLVSQFDTNDISYDLPSTVHITEWAYGQVQVAGGLTWLKGNEQLISLSTKWKTDLKRIGV